VVLALIFVFARRWVRLAPAMSVPLALLLLVYLAMPSQLATASGADHRIPLLLGPRAGRQQRMDGAARHGATDFPGRALALFAVRLASSRRRGATATGSTPACCRRSTPCRREAASPSRIRPRRSIPTRRRWAHFPTLAIVRRDAFVPTLFAFPTQQPVALRPEYRALADRLAPERLGPGS